MLNQKLVKTQVKIRDKSECDLHNWKVHTNNWPPVDQPNKNEGEYFFQIK